ncbi:MAG: hypothetical protein A2Z29_04770 [Chloroflexi bacterium RBG_16_56_11]|nr:MAG: hypothetical protein A2Z29_04770 [Chloroflexi bacterium RBG_16_56_11]
MEAEIRPFDIKNLPYTVRFGLGSTEPIKRWARFEISKNGELYWTRGIDVRKDVDSSNIHTIVHQSGEIHSSRYTGKGEEQKKVYQSEATDIGSTLKDIKSPYQVECGSEHLVPSYVYYGLPPLTQKDKKIDAQNTFVACLDEYLINSRLSYSLDLLPWTKREQVIDYASHSTTLFNADDRRCHMYIFYYGEASIVVTMKFIEGDTPIAIQKVLEADKNRKPLKRLFQHEKLNLSESASLNVIPTKRL